MSVPVYRGHFGRAEAERLLWRAGFGPRPGQAEALAKLGLRKAVLSLTRPGKERLVGPAPRDDRGLALAPADAYGHEQLWWLDRMVRTNRPLIERMTLIWHDWFATSNAGVGAQRLMLNQNQLFRRMALGSFHDLLLSITHDPAMLMWLSGYANRKGSPNENYARELMELFTLGADRGYDENDVREQARALTGWFGLKDTGPQTFKFLPERHDAGQKRIFGKSGPFDWRDACRLCIHHPRHPSFFVRKLWSYFIPEVPIASTQRRLEGLYRRDFQVRPVVEAILMHPRLYSGPRMVKPAVVYTAGLLRLRPQRLRGLTYPWLIGQAGQKLFYPPNVAGWDNTAWLDTSTLRERWDIVRQVIAKDALLPGRDVAPHEAAKLVERAHRFWGHPTLTRRSHRTLLAIAREALETAGNSADRKKEYPPMVENALRQLIGVSPDLQTS